MTAAQRTAGQLTRFAGLAFEVLLPVLLVPAIGLVLWGNSRRARLIWFGVITAILGGIRFAASVPHFDQNSLFTYIDAGLPASVPEDFRVTST